MTKAKILDIFKSIQGEGKYVGIKQVFVRFAACNMGCIWCDTPVINENESGGFKEMSVSEVFANISQLWEDAHSVSLTGGEPLLQKYFLKELLVLMEQSRMPSYLETNGILYKELQSIINDVDIIAMDIKLPSSTRDKPYWEEHHRFLDIAIKKDVFIKATITTDTTQEDIQRAVQLVAEINPKVLFVLQPNTKQLDEVIPKCLEYQNYCLKYLKDVRIIPQTHKIMGLK